METMDVEEEVVDLSLRNTRRVPEVARISPVCWPAPRRCLRPRTEMRSYVETADVVPVVEEPRTNGYANGVNDIDDEELPMPPLPVVKVMSDSEMKQREESVRRLRTELRNEEMTLVLLKKLRQSYQMKDNVAIVNPCSTVANAVPAVGINSGGITGNTMPTVPPAGLAIRQAPPRTSSKPPPPQPSVHLLRTPAMNSRSAPSMHVPPPVLPNRGISPGLPPVSGGSMLQPATTNVPRSNNNISARNLGLSFSAERKDSRHSPVSVSTQQLTGPVDKVGINIPLPQISSEQDRGRLEDGQTPAQRQAAAKLALRKQLEKTLLQIPPPKPPPPEMHFIPNPSNTEFIYLVGLEHVVDFITKDSRSPPPPEPFRCSQCSTNFTPVWKWEKGSVKGKEPKVICEQCVTSNVKKALKAEHTNRLKTAFVKALQQEQEIEQRLAQGSPGPDNIVVMGQMNNIAGTSTGSIAVTGGASGASGGVCSGQSTSIHCQGGPTMGVGGGGSSVGVVPAAATPQPPPPLPPPPQLVVGKPATPKPTPPPQQSSSNRDHLAKLADTAKLNAHHAAAAIHQQLLRGLPPHQPLPAHMLPFTPLLYPYQLAMAGAAAGAAAASASAGSKAGAVNIAELQRQAADLQRQYLLDMIPPPNPTRHSVNNWKT